MRQNSVDLTSSVSQAAFARMVGVSAARISQLVSSGVLAPDGTAGDWLIAYCENLRSAASGRQSSGDLDLSQERAALAREQRVSYEIKNAVSRGDYAPIELLADVLAGASQAVVDRFDKLPGLLKKKRPSLTADDHAAIQTVIAAARREWLRSTTDGLRQRLTAPSAEATA